MQTLDEWLKDHGVGDDFDYKVWFSTYWPGQLIAGYYCETVAVNEKQCRAFKDLMEELYPHAAKDLLGITDFQHCVEGKSFGACVWTAAAFLPIGKVKKLIELGLIDARAMEAARGFMRYGSSDLSEMAYEYRMAYGVLPEENIAIFEYSTGAGPAYISTTSKVSVGHLSVGSVILIPPRQR
jgi:hypothetical protein